MIGGKDVVVHTCNPGAARDVAVRRASSRWPRAVCDVDGDTVHVYVDAEARRAWVRSGSTERNRDALLSVTTSAGAVTLVTDGPTTAAIASEVVEALRANWAQFSPVVEIGHD